MSGTAFLTLPPRAKRVVERVGRAAAGVAGKIAREIAPHPRPLPTAPLRGERGVRTASFPFIL